MKSKWLNYKSNWITIPVIATVGLALGFYIGKFYSFPLANSPKELGDFGGFIGGVIGTIVAIGAILFSIQTNQRQNKQFERQSFENVFFQMMTLYAQKKNNLESQHFSNLKGVIVFDAILKDLQKRTNGYLKPEDEKIYKTLVWEIYKNDYKNELGVLVIQFTLTLKYIDKSNNEPETKRDFIDIFYSQFSLSEIELLIRLAKIDTDLEKLFEKYPFIP